MRPLPLLPTVPPGTEDPTAYLGEQLGWLPETVERAGELLDRGLPPLVTVRTLPFLFGVSASFLNHMRRSPARYYQPFQIPKRRGAPRHIDAPTVALKIVQRWLYDHVLSRQAVHPAAIGFVPASATLVPRGILENAGLHLGRRNLMSLDVDAFFPSIPSASVYAVFASIFHPAVAAQLHDLTTLRGGLPQGAPTSPALSNLTMNGVDNALAELAESWSATYTRYADDMTFSSDDHMFTAGDERSVGDIIGRMGLQLNPQKTKRIGRGYRHQVTGLAANVVVQPPRWRRRQWRALFDQARRDPENFVGRVGYLAGVAGHIGQTDPEWGDWCKGVVARVEAAAKG
jgi:RNA-directed DNA polymerase